MGHVPHLLVPDPWGDGVVELSGDHLHHLFNVMRLRPGTEVTYTDGRGVVGEGHVADNCIVRGVEIQRPRAAHVEIVVPPPGSKSRQRFLVEKLTELGVARLIWVETKHSQGRPPNPQKAAAWMASAVEQSRSAWSLVIEQARLEDLDRVELLVADPAGVPLHTGAGGPVTVLIGPEGGLHSDDLPQGAKPVALGGNILRVETAAVVAAGILLATG